MSMPWAGRATSDFRNCEVKEHKFTVHITSQHCPHGNMQKVTEGGMMWTKNSQRPSCSSCFLLLRSRIWNRSCLIRVKRFRIRVEKRTLPEKFQSTDESICFVTIPLNQIRKSLFRAEPNKTQLKEIRMKKIIRVFKLLSGSNNYTPTSQSHNTV